MTDLLSLTPEELTEFCISLGESAFRAKQIFSHLTLGKSPDEMQNLPKTLREKLKENASFRLPTVEKKLVSAKDGTLPPV